MCGISGIINKSKNKVSESDLKSMNDLIIHRGPDAEGYYYNERIGFGHRRLSILDLSKLGDQPMEYSDLTITYNGEVYNYIEIREELREKGYVFKSETDTEVILAAYQEWGENCVQYFNGMWAFAIHDRKKNIVFLSRDRFGIKPLYYHNNQKAFYFGSEIKQLLYFNPNPKVNKQILFDYIYLTYHHHTNHTFFQDIESLEPSHNLICNLEDSTIIIKRYYHLETNLLYKRIKFDQALSEYKTLIKRSIDLRLRSDVKVGTCLSGGMDSSFIAASASPIYKEKCNERFTAITAKSIEKKTDESGFAQMVVERHDLDWNITQPNKEDFFNFVEDVIKIQEEPFGSPSIIMQYFVMKKAKEAKCIVLLDGQGGDETLLGYDRYYATYINEQQGFINKVRALWSVSRNSKLSLKDVLLYNLYFNNVLIRKYRQLKRHNYIKPAYKKYFNNVFLKKLSNYNSSVSKLQHSEITKIQLQKLLKYEDRNSMSQSIETRVPFIDHNVVELAISIPFEFKMVDGWSKYILRKASEDILPEKIVWRKNKFGFEAPQDKWLSDKEYFLKIIKESQFLASFIDFEKITKKVDNNTLWKLFNIAVWADKFKVSF
ncbi:asparagine synthase (glutamine-hydrolyzing) [Algibacter sp. 2305UL17-15]|uniref:asparagine synthase (glutamine-hydrolyzing) n=1 Tax=Algibacter sp. 2305UL17-15 TaxID=3231268 RepID=UPI0034597A9F